VVLYRTCTARHFTSTKESGCTHRGRRGQGGNGPGRAVGDGDAAVVLRSRREIGEVRRVGVRIGRRLGGV
jgi:hypothetical protein